MRKDAEEYLKQMDAEAAALRSGKAPPPAQEPEKAPAHVDSAEEAYMKELEKGWQERQAAAAEKAKEASTKDGL